MTEVTATPTEAEALLSVLERNRRTFAWKTSGLDEKGLCATTAASSMTLGGLVKHMALVEADWLAVKLAGEEHGPRGTASTSRPSPTGSGAPAQPTLRARRTRCGGPRSSAPASWWRP